MAVKLFGKVLIATDGSENNRSALEEGIKVVRECGGAGYAVYVIDSRTLSTSSAEIPVGDACEVSMEEAKKAFDLLKSMSGDVKFETKILDGRPGMEIVKFAEKEGIDLIVIGTKGKKGLERLLLGSVAEEVIRSATCKVLVVK
ncbi:UspA domain protein [Methanolacinia petrolearia DSM 11571]|uniref:UspA domain protein n=1 Tax=Methanolacinia petrolearia (strain DSM 11571 / OCM 486 / SEBR 4847) TaxID=679926 RepID=E1RHN9_METP4|nr:universal stress protein [Methanolacinia petrolearia]ADN35348.1 UspA domain protein [Methanolacinia petrolearia DSM 11571]